MPSLIEQSVDQEDPLKSAQGYEAERVSMGDDDTVEKRLAGIINEDSELMQIAKTQAKQGSNRKGLLNTNLAINSAQKGVIEKATPIASQDASTASNYKLSNQNADNTAGQFNATQSNQARSQLQSGNQSLAQIAASGQEQRKGIEANIEGETQLQEQRGDIQLEHDRVMQEFQTKENEIERAFEGNQNAEARILERENAIRSAATELMRQVSGQNATLTDAISRVNASEMTVENKRSMIREMTTLHYNNLNTTAAMADYDIVDGEVVYRGEAA